MATDDDADDDDDDDDDGDHDDDDEDSIRSSFSEPGIPFGHVTRARSGATPWWNRRRVGLSPLPRSASTKNHRTTLVVVVKRPLEPLSIFQDPGIRLLVFHVIPAVHTMVADILLEGAPTGTMATNQARTTHHLASGDALREVNPAALRGGASADHPRLPSG